MMNMEAFQEIQKKLTSVRNPIVTMGSNSMTSAPTNTESKGTTTREMGQNYYQLAKLHYDKADLEKAEKFFLKSLDACVLPEDTFAMMKICGFLIRVYSEFLRQDEVRNYVELSQLLLNAAFSNPEWSAKADYFFYMGATKTYVGDFEEAINNFNIAFKKAQESNEPELVAKSLLFMAHNQYLMGHFEQTENLLAQLEQLLTILNKGYLKGSMNILYGNIYNHKGEYKKALEYFKKSSEELNKKVCWNLFGYTCLGMGKSYKKMGNYKKALLYFEMAKNHTNRNFKKLHQKIDGEISEVNDSNIDFVIDKTERIIKEKTLGVIDFKHRFVLLEILYLLASNPGKFFDKEDLSRDIWREEYNPLIHDKLIYTSISRLRKLIEPSGEKNKYIVRGKDGYTFSPHVKVRFCHNTPQSRESIGNVEIGSPL